MICEKIFIDDSILVNESLVQLKPRFDKTKR